MHIMGVRHEQPIKEAADPHRVPVIVLLGMPRTTAMIVITTATMIGRMTVLIMMARGCHGCDSSVPGW
jgi:hypothetical protein